MKNIYIRIYRYHIYIFIYLSTYLPIYLSTYLPIYLSIFLSIYPSIHLSYPILSYPIPSHPILSIYLSLHMYTVYLCIWTYSSNVYIICVVDSMMYKLSTLTANKMAQLSCFSLQGTLANQLFCGVAPSTFPIMESRTSNIICIYIHVYVCISVYIYVQKHWT